MVHPTGSNLSTAETGRIAEISDQLSVSIGKLGMGLARGQAAQIPVLMDALKAHVDSMDPGSPGGKTILADFETHSRALRKNIRLYRRELGDLNGLKAIRPATFDPESHWWWDPDAQIRADRQRALRGLIRTLLIIAGILAVAVVIYQRFLQPDPKVVEVMDTRNEVNEIIVGKKDLNAALDRLNLGLERVGEDGELLVVRSGIYLLQGKTGAAEDELQTGSRVLGSEESALAIRMQFFSVVQEPIRSETDGLRLIKLNPKSAIGYLLIGQAYEDQGKYGEAYRAYEQSSNLGIDDDPAIAAQARIKMGMLMQQLEMLPNQQTQAAPQE